MLERLVAHRQRWSIVTVLAGLVLGIGFALGSFADLRSVSSQQPPSTPQGIVVVEPTPVPTTSTEVVVHVSGAVHRPGVYHLRQGLRVRDAISSAAGGPTDDADPNALNLAAPLKDGQRIAVPLAASAEQPRVAIATVEHPPINLNTASAAELETLPGVGPVIAGRIVAYRQESGGFTSVDELLAQKIVNDSTFQKLKDLVVVQ